jgi:putative flippase GtrA
VTQQASNVTRPLAAGIGRGWNWLTGFVATRGRLLQFARYLTVSFLALGVDLAVFWALVASGDFEAVVAGATGVLAGLVVHYTLSAFFVFADQETGKSHRRLISEYVLSAGVLITSAVIFAMVNLAGLAPFAGKGVAVVITFVVVYHVHRKTIVPRGPGRYACADTSDPTACDKCGPGEKRCP